MEATLNSANYRTKRNALTDDDSLRDEEMALLLGEASSFMEQMLGREPGVDELARMLGVLRPVTELIAKERVQEALLNGRQADKVEHFWWEARRHKRMRYRPAGRRPRTQSVSVSGPEDGSIPF